MEIGCSIWSVELIRRFIVKIHQETLLQEEKQRQQRQQQLEQLEATGGVLIQDNKEYLEGEGGKGEEDMKINAILIDFFLYDTLKEVLLSQKLGEGPPHERGIEGTVMMPHHRTRSIWY